MEEKEFIYVCSPYGGKEENYKRALFYGRYVVSKGYIPIIPHTMLHGILEDKNPSEREIGLKAGRFLLKICKEVWVFGVRKTAGMKAEISLAENVGIPIKEIKDSFSINTQAEKLSMLLKEYEALTCSFVNRAIIDDIVTYLNEGLSEYLIVEAIKIAARKHAYWNYASAILRNCKRQGIYTLEEMNKGQSKTNGQETFAAYDLDAFERKLNQD